MEKRKVTVVVGGSPCSFYSDDSDAYLSALEQRANEVMRQTAPFSGPSAQMNAIYALVLQTDVLMSAEEKLRKRDAEKDEGELKRQMTRKPAGKATGREDKKQISIWDLMK